MGIIKYNCIFKNVLLKCTHSINTIDLNSYRYIWDISILFYTNTLNVCKTKRQVVHNINENQQKYMLSNTAKSLHDASVFLQFSTYKTILIAITTR